jgi:hypothetical protein
VLFKYRPHGGWGRIFAVKRGDQRHECRTRKEREHVSFGHEEQGAGRLSRRKAASKIKSQPSLTGSK